MTDKLKSELEKLKGLSVLYVEDDINVRESLLRFLRRRFDNIHYAKDGKEGLAQYMEHKPDIVITDIQMPMMDGLEMASRIMQDNPEVKIIVTTAFNEEPFLERAGKLGIEHYIKKPVLKDDLVSSLLECVGS
ncbi:response regulator transcription factor [Limisalsivibrio acetivorans]|uniref:response regulator transcription factor n=1 Tax=Limisalsivibrio acetivorans TaxID=1304888 RepID=UPI0003B55220|nr:response regulator [Limisalsivibrio acetivorans]